MNLFDFLEDYQGFFWIKGEISIVDQRKGIFRICTVREGETRDRALYWMGSELTEDWNKPVWSWTHTEKTMLIVL